MSECPEELQYSKSHEWVKVDNGEAIIGITDHAQSMLGDLVFVELPEVNSTIAKGDEVAVVESVKTAADIYTPVSGEIVAVNDQLEGQPDHVNQDPYQNGWLFRVKMSDASELDQLLNASDYTATIED